MSSGKRTGEAPSLGQIRERTRASIAQLPPALHALDAEDSYSVIVSDALRALAARVDAEFD